MLYFILQGKGKGKGVYARHKVYVKLELISPLILNLGLR